MNTCPNCGKIAGLHSSILQGCMCQYSMQAPPQQEPVAYWKEYAKGLQRDYDSLLADFQAQQEERNFCQRCGKRTKDIHTCTPPQPYE